LFKKTQNLIIKLYIYKKKYYRMCANVRKCIHVHITSFAYKLSVLKISMCNANYRLAVELINLSNTSNYLKTLKKDYVINMYIGY